MFGRKKEVKVDEHKKYKCWKCKREFEIIPPHSPNVLFCDECLAKYPMLWSMTHKAKK